MEYLEKIIKERRSVSQFLDRAVAREVIDELIELSSYAPSSCNTQPWFFVVFESEEAKEKLREYIELGYQKTKEEFRKKNRLLSGLFSRALDSFAKYGQFDAAPMYILVFVRPYDKAGLAQAIKISKNKMISEIAEESVKTSVAMAMQNFLLAAHAKGLGTRVKDGIKFFVSHAELRDEFYEEFSIAKEYGLLSGIQLGYPLDGSKLAGKRLSLDKIRKFL